MTEKQETPTEREARLRAIIQRDRDIAQIVETRPKRPVDATRDFCSLYPSLDLLKD